MRVSTLLLLLVLRLGAEDAPHAECSFFGQGRERYADQLNRSAALTRVTEQVIARRPRAMSPRARSFEDPTKLGLIDSYLYADMRANGVQPAAKTTDWEFIRRVTLDLAGRIPKPERVLAFVADTTPDKRARLIDELLGRPEWIDRWTMYFGDLFKNTDTRPSTSLRRFPQGRNAFYQYIRDSLTANKPYNQIAAELIAAQGPNSYEKGELNWILNGFVTGGPSQDIVDQTAANVAETFLGISHMNCVLCHNGRGHLDALSLWGSTTTRFQAWQFASFFSRTAMTRTRPSADNPNVYYWAVADSGKTDYALNTTTGNRPARQPSASYNCPARGTCTIAPNYFFTGEVPAAGENYRAAAARIITGDIQFARAAVNYIWAQFFGRGIVDPPNQFDPARLDPDNPPTDPWTLEPSNPRLLNALAKAFVDNNYDLKWLMREMANSEAYQLSSAYAGNWDPSWEKYFARKFVRRLWAEEIHDAVVQSSGVIPNYNVNAFGTVNYAMQLPDTVNVPGGAVNTFLDAFLRPNRDDQERRAEGSVLQALSLMNDAFVMSRLAATGANANTLLTGNLSKPDPDLVDALFLGVLSRYPSAAEKSAALDALASGASTQKAQDLLWSLYNKVDFLFNY